MASTRSLAYLYTVKALITILPALMYMFISAGCERSEAMYLQAPQNKYIVCKGSALYLDNGRKWKANKETTQGIDSMIAQVNKVPADADTAVYHRLGNELMSDYIYIVNYCASMGENHEMVHAYLNPMQEMIVPLQISGLTTCQNQMIKLKEHLDRYHVYFD